MRSLRRLRRRRRRRRVLRLCGCMLLQRLGGVAAVPFAGLALWITSLLIFIGDDDPKTWTRKRELDKALLSGPFGTVFARGIPAALGADISKRITLSDLVTIPFADMPDYIEGRAASDRLAAAILGPTFDASVRMGLEARKAMRDGDFKFLYSVRA